MIIPMNDHLLVVRSEEKTRSAGGIIIPDNAKEKPQEGQVIAVGPGKVGEDGKRVPMDIKTGDRVLFSRYGGTEMEIGGVTHLFLRQNDILGVLE